jgi:1,2-diacylglycerol 3-alpha-glucosyltransferase
MKKELQKPLRIAVVTNNYLPYSGGVVSSIMAFTAELKRQGHEVLLITLDFGVSQQADDPAVRRVYCPIKFRYKKNYMAIPWRANAQVYALLKVFNPDVIHSQHPFLLGNAARRAARKLRVPITFTYHTVYQDYAHYVPLPAWLVKPLITRWVNRYASSVNQVITPSRAVEHYLHNAGVQTQKAFICSGLQAQFVPKQQPRKERVAGKPFELLVVSRFVPEKNIGFVLDLFADLERRFPSDYALTLIGYGQDFEPLRAYAYEQLRLPVSRVKFIHQPDKAVIAQAYCSADLFVFSSLTDVQPLVLVEAMAGATPIVALAGAGRAMIQHGYNGFIVPDAQEMIQTIIRIAHDKELHQQLQNNAWQTAQDFTPERATQRLVAAYEQMRQAYNTV